MAQLGVFCGGPFPASTNSMSRLQLLALEHVNRTPGNALAGAIKKRDNQDIIMPNNLTLT